MLWDLGRFKLTMLLYPQDNDELFIPVRSNPAVDCGGDPAGFQSADSRLIRSKSKGAHSVLIERFYSPA
jgi:hypothetical protein